MIRGIIEHGLHPRVSLEIQGASDKVTLPVLIDTGFDVDIGLHFDFADRLGLDIYDFALFEYANGQTSQDLLCRGQILWHGRWQEVDIVLTADEEPALGTRLLRGCVMNLDFVHNSLSIHKSVT